ncbi:hypothetical protein DVH24_030082 [Malus domestica]|uniref:Uncharacterized protein n=1 Tax=Malus domestica TaxID=3750 RepID=A0A498I1P4_MALDO|nr:hypothetical protein DVH24_030082 [Malus domestica]
MVARSISLAHFPPPNRHAGIPSRPRMCDGVSDLVTISRFGVSSVDFWLFVSFLLRCLGRIDLSVAFSSIAALVATGKTFVIPAAAAVCFWKLGIRVSIFVSLLFGLGFMYMIPPNLLWVIFPFRLDWPVTFFT